MGEVVTVSVIGNFLVALADGRSASFRTRRAAEIVALLSLQLSRRMLRSEVAANIWPDSDRSARLSNLRPALNYARAALEDQGAIVSSEDWLILGDQVVTDIAEANRMELRLQRAPSGDERLVLLYSLNDLVQKPLLENWDCEWLETPRVDHDQRRLSSLRRLSEELGSRGEWTAGLDYARRMSQIDPTSEDGVRLQLRFLGELERPSEAQRAFSLYAKNLKSSLDLPVNDSLRVFAEEVAGGRFRRTGSRPLTALQQEMISEMIEVLAADEPERLLPLLSSPKLNWSLVFHGLEMQPMLERAMNATSGWSPERCGVAKRLLQVYAQEQKWSELNELATGLVSSSDPTDKIAALNFLAFERKAALDYPAALRHYELASRLAVESDNDYLDAISIANRAILNICFDMYQLGLKELALVLDRLGERKEPNARYGASLAKTWVLAAHLGKADLPSSERAANEWRLFAETNGTLAFDAQGKLFYGIWLARSGHRASRSWLTAGIDSAFQSRHQTILLEALFPVVSGLKALGMERDAAIATGAILVATKQIGYQVAPFHQRMLAEGVVDASTKVAGVVEVLGLCRERLLASG